MDGVEEGEGEGEGWVEREGERRRARSAVRRVMRVRRVGLDSIVVVA